MNGVLIDVGEAFQLIAEGDNKLSVVNANIP